jgi:hypothetical protein
LPIVACLSVAIATVVNTRHIAYSMQVTVSLLMQKTFSDVLVLSANLQKWLLLVTVMEFTRMQQ